ncbi:lipopolysaccharide transport system ATP-binding protein [Candidatus Electrothrix marina]|uniref:Lipopolysaccharide transport system ATP-binding protein n=2 Tax=Candidatus Electrothrix marina TaxID=1859130 RepID=A0A444JCU8_9BACT|nr:lipopolysaccharide transport system ATP-binding protein [Candidatus Electrothrix marina]
MSTVISIENLWKEYRLGVIGHGTLTKDLQSWWAKVRGKEDPNSQIAPMMAGQEKQIDGDHFWALQDVNLEVKEGEILGVIGKNGAGKSTLLKILSRVTAPTKGNIKVKGRIASLLEVGTGFHPELTGRENIFMNGAILGMSKWEIRNKLDEIIDFSGVEDFVDTPVKRYSSGMYVRLAFAVAAHLEPEILIIDEVLAVGDAEFQKKCTGKMKEVSGQGRTVIFVSHNLNTVKALCGQCVELRHGRISEKKDTESVVSAYLKNDREKVHNDIDTAGYISQKASVYNTGQIKFNRINIIDKKDVVIQDVVYRDDIRLKLQLSSDANYDDLLFHTYINTAEGTNVSYATNLYKDVDVPLMRGENHLFIQLANNLQPGEYFISCSVSKVDGMTLDYVENIIKFNIYVDSALSRPIAWKNPYRGLTVLDSRWRVQ